MMRSLFILLSLAVVFLILFSSDLLGSLAKLEMKINRDPTLISSSDFCLKVENVPRVSKEMFE